MTMVFQTSSNIEMQNGGIGYFLLGIPAIPLSWLIYRKRPLIVWGIVSFAAYGVSTFFTYNLRYYMAIFMMAVMLITVALCIICNRIFRIIIYKILFCNFNISILTDNFIPYAKHIVCRKIRRIISVKCKTKTHH